MKNKLILLSLILIIISLGCLTTYTLIGSTVAPDGTLVEPFYLIPLGYLFGIAGIAVFVFRQIRTHVLKK